MDLPSGRTAHVPKCVIQFPRWRGEDVKNTYGGKAILVLRNKPLFAELMVLRLLERKGWHGVWVDTYGGECRTGMPGVAEPVKLPEREEDFLKKIRGKAGCRGGCFDVFAWRGRKYRFVELKRHGKDQIRLSQKRWIEAACRCGIKMSDLLIVEWDATEPPTSACFGQTSRVSQRRRDLGHRRMQVTSYNHHRSASFLRALVV